MTTLLDCTSRSPGLVLIPYTMRSNARLARAAAVRIKVVSLYER